MNDFTLNKKNISNMKDTSTLADKDNDKNESIFPSSHSLDSPDLSILHCVKCGKVIKDLNKKELKKYRILFNGRYCLSCFKDIEMELESILNELIDLKLAYNKILKIIFSIINLYDLNNSSDLMFYIENLKTYLKNKEVQQSIDRYLSL